MRKLAILMILLVSGVASAQSDDQLTVGLYAPGAAFADSSARLAYVQGLAKAIAGRTGTPVVGKAYVRLGDLLAAKPDFAIIDGQCLASRGVGNLLATAVIGGDVTQGWGLYTRGGDTLASLKGKKLAYVKTSCRDGEFLDNAMLDGEVKTAAFFGALVDKPDVTAAVLAVRDYMSADAVFAPAAQARGLSRTYDAGSVPNPGFVALRTFTGPVLEQARDAVLGYGGGGGIDGWRAATPGAYTTLGGRMGTRVKKLVFAPPEIVRIDDQDILLLPPARTEQAGIKQHFWEPTRIEQ